MSDSASTHDQLPPEDPCSVPGTDAGAPQGADATTDSGITASESEDSPPESLAPGPVAVDPTAAEQEAVDELAREMAQRLAWEAWQRQKWRRLRLSLGLFVLTFVSTTLVGANFWPLDILPAFVNDEYRQEMVTFFNENWPTDEPTSIYDRFWQSCAAGCQYSIPLMFILLCHEMGHYLQARRYDVPASFPYFIPLPLPPLGTMGAVILQGKGIADRKQMFDIAVTGPIAGLVVTLPILIYGIYTSSYVPSSWIGAYEFGQPLLVKWLIHAIHGVGGPGLSFRWNGYATAGWVGIFITAMNLLPIGQLDGGHILYTLIGRPAHWVAWGLIILAVVIMLSTGLFSYVLLLILLTLTGPRHPPTADDTVPLGRMRHCLGWLTLGFLIIGFTFQPIVVSEEASEPPSNVLQPLPPEETVEEPQEFLNVGKLPAGTSRTLVHSPTRESEITVM